MSPRRKQYDLNPAGEAAYTALVQAGVSVERVQHARERLNTMAERMGLRGEPSRAVHAAVNATDMPEFHLPHVDDWRLLVSCHHRTLAGLEDHERTVLRFVRAQYAVMALRGLDTEHLLKDVGDGEAAVKKLDMYRVIESWQTLDRDVFTCIMHVLLYTKAVGSQKTLERLKLCIDSLACAYYEALQVVRSPSSRDTTLFTACVVGVCAMQWSAVACHAWPWRLLVRSIIVSYGQRLGWRAGGGEGWSLSAVSACCQERAHVHQGLAARRGAEDHDTDAGSDQARGRIYVCRRVHHAAGVCPCCCFVVVVICDWGPAVGCKAAHQRRPCGRHVAVVSSRRGSNECTCRRGRCLRSPAPWG